MSSSDFDLDFFRLSFLGFGKSDSQNAFLKDHFGLISLDAARERERALEKTMFQFNDSVRFSLHFSSLL
jgi:hypothetical protein